jgi:hypothetical protein
MNPFDPETLRKRFYARLALGKTKRPSTVTVEEWKFRYGAIPKQIRELLEVRHAVGSEELVAAYRVYHFRLRFLGVDPFVDLSDCMTRLETAIKSGHHLEKNVLLHHLVLLVWDELRPLAEMSESVRWEGFVGDDEAVPIPLDVDELITNMLTHILERPATKFLKALEHYAQTIIDKRDASRGLMSRVPDALRPGSLLISHHGPTVRYPVSGGWRTGLSPQARALLRLLRDSPTGCTIEDFCTQLETVAGGNRIYDADHAGKQCRRLAKKLLETGAPFRVALLNDTSPSRWCLQLVPEDSSDRDDVR